MNVVRHLAYRAFILSGVPMLLGPVVFELDPMGLVSSHFAQVQFLVFELFAALTAFWAYQAASHGKIWAVFGTLICAAVSAGNGVWIARYLGTSEAVFLTATPLVIAIGCSTMILILAASLVAVGAFLTVIVTAFLLFGYIGQFFPQLLSAPNVYFSSYMTYLVFGSSGLLGRALDIIANIVVVFVVFGAFFAVAGGGRVISSIALRIALRSKSNAIKACVIASGLFGTVSGTAASNVLISGTFSIPSMRKIGVNSHTAAGIEAAASTCGQITPPVLGAAAFFLADFAGVSYSTVVIAALVPALACYYALFRQADLVRLDADTKEHVPLPDNFEVAWLLFLLPPLIIVIFLLRSETLVSLAAIAGTATCVIISILLSGWKGSINKCREMLGNLIVNVMNLMVAAAAIGLLLGVLNSTGVAVAAAIRISSLAEESLVLALLLTAGATFILGMGMATVGVYIVASTLLAPGLIGAGVTPLAAHFFVLYCGILSMITPPVAFASLAASALAEADFYATSREAMRFGWMLFVMPFLIVLQPGLLMLGQWPDIFLSTLLTFVFIASATATNLNRVTKLTLIAISCVAITWHGVQWVSLVLAIPVATILFGGRFLNGVAAVFKTS